MDRNKIATELSPEDLRAFIELCAKTRKLTLRKIKELAAARGIQVSIMSAKSFRDTTFSRHLARLHKAQETALQIAAVQQQGAGNTIADAGAALLAQEVFDLLNTSDSDEIRLDMDKLSLVLDRLRKGDMRVRLLEQRIREYEEKLAREAAKGEAAREILGDTESPIEQREARMKEVFGL